MEQHPVERRALRMSRTIDSLHIGKADSKLFYSRALFTLSHVYIWGVVSTAMHSKELIISVFIMGVAWSFI